MIVAIPGSSASSLEWPERDYAKTIDQGSGGNGWIRTSDLSLMKTPL